MRHLEITYNRKHMTTPALRRRRETMLPLAVAFYALVLLGAAFQHHDLACHLKSTTHCTSCTLTLSAAGGIDGGAAPPSVSLADAGQLSREQVRVVVTPVLVVTNDRSPPA